MGHLISIHGLLGIEIDDKSPWAAAWDELFADVVKLSPDPDGPPQSILSVAYKPISIPQDMRELKENVYVRENAILDHLYRAELSWPEKTRLSIGTDHPCIEWIAWALQLCALSVGNTFVHAAAVEKEGQAFLFPSWGGIGKTAIVARFVRDWDWKLLGDDHILLAPDGTCYGFPKPLVVYSYHQSVFPELFEQHGGPVAPRGMNNLLTYAARTVKPILRPFPGLLQFARKHNPQSVRVHPSKAFGASALARAGKAAKVVWIERVKGVRRAELRTADQTLESRIMGSTLTEYDPWCVGLSNVAMGLGILHIDDFYDAWSRTLRSGLSQTAKYFLRVPHDTPVGEMPDIVRELVLE